MGASELADDTARSLGLPAFGDVVGAAASGR
jgi:hypothetical protein